MNVRVYGGVPHTYMEVSVREGCCSLAAAFRRVYDGQSYSESSVESNAWRGDSCHYVC